MSITFDDVQDFAQTHLAPIGIKLLVALVILFFGRLIAKAIWRALDRVLERGKVDISLRKFLGDVVYAVMFIAVVIAALDEVGVRTTAVLAILGAAGLAIGLAVQGSLSNFAAGVLLIVLRPYRVDDVVTVGKYSGRVDIIRVFNTVLITADNREIMIPNGQIIAQPIENLTAMGKRRVDLLVTVTAPNDLDKIRALLDAVIRADDRLQQPPPPVDVAEISDANVKLYLRPWTGNEHYAKVVGDTMERVRASFDAAGMKYTIALQAPA